jgi:mannose-1-phosphate guanylyltransferase
LAACEYTSSNSSIVTLSIKPTRPDTGYGYIEFDQKDKAGIRKVTSFKEKPNPDAALRYLKAGNFAWNAGIFIWRLNVILDAFRIHAPQIFNVLSSGNDVYNTEKENDFINNEYPRTDKISVDYAILEKANNVYTIPCDIGWSDLGTWNSLYDISPKDEVQNAPLNIPVYLEGTNNSLVFSKKSKLIVIKGLEDYIIVDTDDCLLIYPKSEEQGIKSLKEILREKGLDEYL